MELKLNSIYEKNILSICLLDGFTSSQLLNEKEKEVVLRLMHRLGGNEDAYYKDGNE